MTNLHEVNFGLNQYCGPSVMSALTGRSTDECAAVISAVSGKKEIKAIEMDFIVKAFKKLRFDVDPVKSYSYTLYGTLVGLAKQKGMYIIGVPRHVVAVEVTDDKVYLIDNHTKQAINAGGSARLSQKVDAIYKITPKPLPKLLESEVIVANDPFYRTVTITSHITYDDPSDNVTTKLGLFRYKDEANLREIVKKLNEMFEDRE